MVGICRIKFIHYVLDPDVSDWTILSTTGLALNSVMMLLFSEIGEIGWPSVAEKSRLL
jgi:hypothetical protein